jgi:hypothetical protein
VAAPAYELIAAVLDLYTLFQRTRAGADPTYADQLTRAIGTLLGARQPEACAPLLNALAIELAVLVRTVGARSGELRMLRKELEFARELTETRTYRLFGELLTIYLELLTLEGELAALNPAG